MNAFSSFGRRRPAVALAAAALVVGSGIVAAHSQATTRAGGTERYIINVAGEPLALNKGSQPGLTRTAPERGQKLDLTSESSRRYEHHLEQLQDAALERVGAKAEARVTATLNAVVATLTPSQAAALSKQSDVVHVWKDAEVHGTTDASSAFLGLSGDKGVWNTYFKGTEKAGSGIIVGVIDSGIWPEHPSLAPLADPAGDEVVAKKWKGSCDAGNTGEPVKCNNKLIGARWYLTERPDIHEKEFRSPRGYHPHGNHVATTIAGNVGVNAELNGQNLGPVTGMAPAARIASYKSLWQTSTDKTSGVFSDTLKAIDQAVKDGVDVINYSVSGPIDVVTGPADLAFMGAAAANVFVAAASGNEGTQGPSLVNHSGPWTTTVAASTHGGRAATRTVRLGDRTYTGTGLGVNTLKDAPVVLASAAGLTGKDATKIKQCYSDEDDQPSNGVAPVLDPALIKGKVVVCERGGNARVDKSLAVKNAGGIGVVQINMAPNLTLNADLHSVPTIHLDVNDGAAFLTQLAANPTATVTFTSAVSTPSRAPIMADFSNYGPAKPGNGDLLKPDITAPGVDILAGSTPINGSGLFELMSGTSMATPHIAGLAALLKQHYPAWTPAMIQSAMMTTAVTTDSDGKTIQRGKADATPMNFGSGLVVPPAMFAPGLVYAHGLDEWRKYTCGLGENPTFNDPKACATFGTMRAIDLNYPSISMGTLAHTETVKRTVTNVTDAAHTYTATVQAPTGMTATVNPSTLTVQPGGTASFSITVTRTDAPLTAYGFGSLTWKADGMNDVRSPIVVQPVAVKVPSKVAGTGNVGTATFPLTSGVATPTQLTVVGATGPTETQKVTVLEGPTNIKTLTFTIPEGAKAARFFTVNTDHPADTDVDIVIKKDGKELGKSRTEFADEVVDLINPAPGTYTVDVEFFGKAAQVDATIHLATLTKDNGNLTVTPSTIDGAPGRAQPITLSWKNILGPRPSFALIQVMQNGTMVDSIPVTILGPVSK